MMRLSPGGDAHEPANRAGVRLACLLALWIAAGAGGAGQATFAQLAERLQLVLYHPGTKPPAFTAQPVDARGIPVAIESLHGKVLIINFWASWCRECRPEMTALDQLHRTYAARGLAIVGVNAREAPDAARRYARELVMSFPLLLDTDGRINALYGVIGVPTTFIVGRDGRAVAFALGERRWESPEARSLIEVLLAEPVPR